jgi:putative phosphoesterase
VSLSEANWLSGGTKQGSLMMKIALVSATHIPDRIPALPPQLLKHLHTVDLILHAGDFVCLDVLESLQAIAETVAVHGNVDEPEVVRQLPRKQILSLAGRKLGLMHGHQPPEIEGEYARPEYNFDTLVVEKLFKYLAEELSAAEIIVFGHFHTPLVKQWGDQLLVNPGSIASHHGHRSFGILELGSIETEVKIIEL